MVQLNNVAVRRLGFLYFICVLSGFSFAQDGWNSCLFRIYDSNGRLLTAKDTLNFEIRNDHSFHKSVKHKVHFPLSSFPDSTWILNTEPYIDHSIPLNEEKIVFHPRLIIVKKSSKDTMRVDYRFLVYAFKEGTDIPLINHIVFTKGEFEVYDYVSKGEWSRMKGSKKIRAKNKKK
jgi:hypothetical protein